jgi:hypothetical protein
MEEKVTLTIKYTIRLTHNTHPTSDIVTLRTHAPSPAGPAARQLHEARTRPERAEDALDRESETRDAHTSP